MKIRDNKIGKGSRCYIIAEIANNHDQIKSQAMELINVAANAGANAVKFQIFDGADIASTTQLASDYKQPGAEKFKYWHEYLDTIRLPLEWLPDLVHLTHQHGMAFIGTPCSIEKARTLVDVGADALKIASMDNNNIPFLKSVSLMNVPVVISGGMADVDDIRVAMDAVGYNEGHELALLHCISNYPTRPEDLNLEMISKYQSLFNVPIGLSDHSLTNYSTFAAIALGINIVEKHITICRELKGPDHLFSLEPDALKDLIRGIREVEAAMKIRSERADLESRNKMYRSIHVNCNIQKGTVLNDSMLEIKRPSDGLEPKYIYEIIGKKVSRDMCAYEPVTWGDLIH